MEIYTAMIQMLYLSLGRHILVIANYLEVLLSTRQCKISVKELMHSIRIWTVKIFMVDRNETSLSAELLRSNGFIHHWITLI